MIIFSPGPANISERVRGSLSRPDICHRDTEFSSLLTNVREILHEIFNLNNGYESIILCGSGTLAIESVVSSFGEFKKKILIVSNGIYGERAAELARFYKIDIEEMKLKWGITPNLDLIEDFLKKDNFAAIYIVHHETTTGLLNPLKEICLLAKKHNKMVLVDAISSIAGEFLDIAGWGIDVVIGSANKCIRGIPGVSFVSASKHFIEEIKRCENRSFYANFLLHLEFERRKQTPFTPPVQAFYAFEEALKELRDEGIENRIYHYREISKYLRTGLFNLGLEFYLASEFMSNTMTLVKIPRGLNYSFLHDSLKQKGFVIYASPERLSQTTFRLGTTGLISKDDINEFINTLKTLL